MKKYIIGVILILTFTATASAQNVDRKCPANVRCEINNLKVKSCPGTNSKVVGTCKKGQILKCLGKMGNCYVVQLPDDTVGLVSNVYCEPSYSK
jgi:uncharacterized protein YgiM (DUF1202 family)